MLIGSLQLPGVGEEFGPGVEGIGGAMERGLDWAYHRLVFLPVARLHIPIQNGRVKVYTMLQAEQG